MRGWHAWHARARQTHTFAAQAYVQWFSARIQDTALHYHNDVRTENKSLLMAASKLILNVPKNNVQLSLIAYYFCCAAQYCLILLMLVLLKELK